LTWIKAPSLEPERFGAMTPEQIALYDQRVPRYTSYPSAPHFNAEVSPDTYGEWLQSLERTEPLSLYLHVPFCAELCLYCGCHTSVARKYAPVAAFVDTIDQEIALVARALPGRMSVSHIHWGGGTPTMLAAPDMKRLMGQLRSLFDIRPGAEIAIEIDPRRISASYVETLGACGFTRASLGVQDFDPMVQQTIRRVQSYEQTAAVVGWLREIGIGSINLDLMYGLPHQAVESVVRSIEMALRLEPDRIALFGYAHVPWMKKHQALLPEAALPNGRERARQMQAAAEAIAKRGYVAIGIDHFAKADDALVRRQAAGELHRNFQGYTTDAAATLIGFGPSAIGSLPQGYVQNAPRMVAYRDAIASERFATVRGRRLSDDDRLRRSIIERLMCDFSVDLASMSSAFGRDLGDLQASLDRVAMLKDSGLAEMEGGRIAIPPHARHLARVVCASFDAYLPSGATRHSVAV
jgi:oxygen-independent coproporphyrinogen-3 oxidase